MANVQLVDELDRLNVAKLSDIPTTAAEVGAATAAQGELADTAVQPDELTKSAVGLPNVDNTSDSDKPVSTATQTALASKVDKVTGFSLSSNDYTTAEKNKLGGIAAGAQVNTVTSVASRTGAVTLTSADVGLSNVTNTSDANKPVSTAQQAALDAKVDKVGGKQLSTNDFTTAEQTKLAGIATGAQVNTVTSVAGRTGAVTLTAADVALGNVSNTSDANKPISTATQTALDAKLPKGYIEDTDTTTTTGITYPTISFKVQKFQPSGSPAGAIRFTEINRYEYNTAQNNSGAGHHAAALNWFVNKSTGNPNQAYAHEAKIDNESTATITLAVGSEAQLASNAGTITNFTGLQARITGNAGTVGTFTGHKVDVTANSGTIQNVIGYEFPDLSALLPSSNRVAYVNRDPGAPVLSAAPIVDQSVSYSSPSATGFMVTIPDKKSIFLVTPAAAYAVGTINLPAKASVSDCSLVEITITQAVTAITWGANGATFVLNGPVSLAAGQTVRFRYFAAIDWWVRVS